MTTSERKWMYAFENGDGRNKMLLGGKGANLCEMTRIGLNVPPGFVITTEACLAYLEKNQPPEGPLDDIKSHMKALEKKTGKGFGSAASSPRASPAQNAISITKMSGDCHSQPRK